MYTSQVHYFVLQLVSVSIGSDQSRVKGSWWLFNKSSIGFQTPLKRLVPQQQPVLLPRSSKVLP
jgi:hypothetical protein